MMTEKTARKREKAVLNSVKPFFEKTGNGLEYLEKYIKESDKRNKAYFESFNKKIEDERDFQFTDQKNRIENEKKLSSQIDVCETAIKANFYELENILKEMNIQCDKCGAFMSPVQIVCHRCGNFSNIFPYKTADSEYIFQQTVSKVLPLSEIFSDTKDGVYEFKSPYVDIKNEFNAMQKVKAVAKHYFEQATSEAEKDNYKRIYEKANEFISDVCNSKIEIAIVGDVKSGKSSLINALLGDTMASVDATPETGVLVKYRTTKNKSYIRVSLYSNAEWEKIYESVKPNEKKLLEKIEKVLPQKDEYIDKEIQYFEFDSKEELKKNIMKWTSSSSPQYFFAKEVEIGYHDERFPSDIVFVDTPGLKDSFEHRSNMTKDYISKAHWVLACVENNNLCIKDNIEFLNNVKANLNHNMQRMYVVATKADMLTKKQREEKQEYFFDMLLSKKVYKSKGILSNHFISVCAEPHYLLLSFLRGEELNEESEDILSVAIQRFKYNMNDIANDKEAIFDSFGINKLFDRLNKNIISKCRQIIISDIKKKYIDTNRYIGSEAKKAFENASIKLQDICNSSNEYYDNTEELDNLNAELEEINNNKIKLDNILSKIEDKE